MVIEQIKINIENKKKHLDVSLLLDHIPFVWDLVALRKKWNVTEFFSPNKEHIQKFYDSISKDTTDKTKITEFEEDIRNLRLKYDYGYSFQQVVRYALLCNEVPEYAYVPCYLTEMSVPFPLCEIEESLSVIVVTPNTTMEQLKTVFDQYQVLHQKRLSTTRLTKEEASFYSDYLEYDPLLPQNIDSKTKPSILFIREGYWLRNKDVINNVSKEPMSASKMGNMMEEKYHGKVDSKSIVTAIKSYEKLLSR